MKVIEEIFIETMREMVYLDVVKTTVPVLDIESLIGHAINVVVPYRGDIVVFFSEQMIKSVGKNIFDCDHKFSKEEFADVIGEFLNVFAGKLLDKLHPNILFEIGLPRMINYKDLSINDCTISNFADPSGGQVALIVPVDKF